MTAFRSSLSTHDQCVPTSTRPELHMDDAKRATSQHTNSSPRCRNRTAANAPHPPYSDRTVTQSPHPRAFFRAWCTSFEGELRKRLQHESCKVCRSECPLICIYKFISRNMIVHDTLNFHVAALQYRHLASYYIYIQGLEVNNGLRRCLGG